MTIRFPGLLSYDHSENIFSAKAVSSDTLGGATLVGTTVGSILYDPDGWTSLGGEVALLYTFPFALDTFSFTFEVEKSFISNLYSAAGKESLFAVAGTNFTTCNVRKNANETIQLLQGTVASQKYTCDLLAYPRFIKLHGVVDSFGVTCRIEGLPALVWPWEKAEGSRVFTSFYWGGFGTTANPALKGYKMRNLGICPYAYNTTVREKYNSYSLIGDSNGRFGGYQTTASLAYILGNITDHYGDSSTVNDDDKGLNGIFPVIHGQLALAGFFPGNERIKFYARGGAQNSPSSGNRTMHQIERIQYAGVQQTGAEAGTATKGTHGWGESRPDVIFNISGSNDILSAITVAQWKTEMQAVYDAVVALGTKKYIYSGVMPQTHVSGYSTYAAIQRVLELNAAARELEIANANFIFTDLWTGFGGVNYSVNLFKSPTNGHLGSLGQYLAGILMAKSFIANA